MILCGAHRPFCPLRGISTLRNEIFQRLCSSFCRLKSLCCLFFCLGGALPGAEPSDERADPAEYCDNGADQRSDISHWFLLGGSGSSGAVAGWWCRQAYPGVRVRVQNISGNGVIVISMFLAGLVVIYIIGQFWDSAIVLLSSGVKILHQSGVLKATMFAPHPYSLRGKSHVCISCCRCSWMADFSPSLVVGDRYCCRRSRDLR